MIRDINNLLLRSGLAPTQARIKVLQVCISSGLPLEVSEVARRVGTTAHLATIYRTLEKLVAASILARIDFQEGKFRYEYPRTHHHHAICESCGKVEDVIDTNTEIGAIEDRVKQESGFSVTRHVMELFGLCNKCQKKGLYA